MFIYMIGKGVELKIRTPGAKDFSQIKTKTIQKEGCNLLQADYPDGLHLEIEQHADKIVVYSNKELMQNEDGSFTAPSM